MRPHLYDNIMNKVIYTFFVLIALVSCGSSYDIQGSSDVSMLDGRMLYLKVYKNNDFKTIDSCDVVHGRFQFSGNMDSVRMATLFMDEKSIMPVVLESGEIVIKIDNTQQRVSGTPLNEKLFGFIDKYNQLENQVGELGHKQSQAIMDGEEEHVVNSRLAREADDIARQEDKLITSFIAENFDNVLGPGVFFMMTAGNRYPELQPWIEDIWSKATDNFKNDSYVKDYYEKARQNEAIMNGTAIQDAAAPMQPEYQQEQQQAPTPNQMAAPEE